MDRRFKTDAELRRFLMEYCRLNGYSNRTLACYLDICVTDNGNRLFINGKRYWTPDCLDMMQDVCTSIDECEEDY